MASSQLNIRLAPDHDAEFDRWASELGVERGKLARDIFTEALAARREGRARFEQPATLGPGDLIAMQATLERGVMEIDRIATTWAKHEADVRRQERDNQAALSHAQNLFIAGVPDRIFNSLNPVREEMLALAERIDRQPRLDAIDAGQRAHTAALEANTIAIERLEKQPRRVTGIVLGDDRFWSTAFIAAWTLMMVGLAFFPLTVVEMAVPGIGIPLANRMVSGDAGFCRLVRDRFESDDCQVPRAHQIPIAFDKAPVTPKAKSDAPPRAKPGVAAHRR